MSSLSPTSQKWQTIISQGGAPGAPPMFIRVNPILHGGGPFMPAGQEMCCGAHEVALKLLPLHDFVPMDLRQVLVESFLGFIFKNFE